MAKPLLLLVLLVVFFSNGAISTHFRPSRFDFDHFARTLDEPKVFQERRNILSTPHLDLANFFEKISSYVETQSVLKEDSKVEEDSEYHPWKKRDIEEISSLSTTDDESSETEKKILKKLMNVNVINAALGLVGEKTEDECPVGTIYTYYQSDKLKECFQLSLKDIAIRQFKYKLTAPLENPPEFPNETDNLFEAIAAPLLNQPAALVVANSLVQGFKDYNVKTPLKLTWPFLWLGNALRNQRMPLEYLAPGHVPNLETYDGYAAFLEEYRERQRGNLFGFFPVGDFIRYPMVEYPTFLNITKTNIWQNDLVFAQQRLAGLNPMSLRKLTINDSIISEYLNPTFDWDGAMRDVSGRSLNQTINDGKAFVLDYPLLQGISNIEDIEADDPLARPLRETVSPITLFASVPGVTGQSENTLRPVAIQMDMDKDAAVFTPCDDSKWLMAKEEVQRADIVYVEVIEHLLKTHLLMQPICVIMRRSFSKLHPLYQLFHPHCRYLAVTNSVGVPALFDQNRYLHILFAIGNTGSINLLNKGYKNMTWEDTNFEENLKKRGVMDSQTLPYFPYRDDGLLLWEKVGKFAEEYVNLYYDKVSPEIEVSVKYKIFERQIISGPAPILTDIELQSFAAQLHAKKIGKINGGRFKGFPIAITSHEQLVDVVKRILFIPIQHSAINYPVSYYGAFTPNMPTKLYDPKTQDFSIDNLPQYNIVAYQLAIAMTLGSIRYDKLFDYSDTLKDDKAKKLVKDYYDDLHGEVNTLIMKRNYKRDLESKFIYPYFMPQWLTNSIQT